MTRKEIFLAAGGLALVFMAGRVGPKYSRERQAKELKKYFLRTKELEKLYWYALEKGYILRAQPKECLSGENWRQAHWLATHKFEKILQGFDIVMSFSIMVPLKYLQCLDRHITKKHFLMSGIEPDFSKITKKELRDLIEKERSLRNQTDCLIMAHEIAHLDLFKAGKDYKECRKGIGCFVDEFSAYVSGMEILRNLGLEEFVGRKWGLEKGFMAVFGQCQECLELLKKGECLYYTEIKKMITENLPSGFDS